MLLNMICAIGISGQFGSENGLPWDNIPEMLPYKKYDQLLFRKYTLYQDIIVGGITARHLPELDNRTIHMWNRGLIELNIQPKHYLDRLEDFLDVKEAWIIGGVQTLRTFAPYINGRRIVHRMPYDGLATHYFPIKAIPELTWTDYVDIRQMVDGDHHG